MLQIVCRNKRDAKQLAAQAMLQKLHPNLNNWASILRLYNSPSNTVFAETVSNVYVACIKNNFICAIIWVHIELCVCVPMLCIEFWIN